MKISNLPQATSVSDDDVVPVVQGGKTKKLPRGVLKIPEDIILRDNTLYLIHDGETLGDGAEIPVVTTDKTYKPTSTNPQSGIAVAEAVAKVVGEAERIDAIIEPRIDFTSYSPAVGTILTDGTYDNSSTNEYVNTILIPVESGYTIRTKDDKVKFDVFLFNEYQQIVKKAYGYTEYTVDSDGYVRIAFYIIGRDNLTGYEEDILNVAIISKGSILDDVPTLKEDVSAVKEQIEEVKADIDAKAEELNSKIQSVDENTNIKFDEVNDKIKTVYEHINDQVNELNLNADAAHGNIDAEIAKLRIEIENKTTTTDSEVTANGKNAVTGEAVTKYVDEAISNVDFANIKVDIDTEAVKAYVDEEIAKIKQITFNTFPTEEEIRALPNKSFFTVRSQGVVDTDVTATYFRTTDWRADALKYTDTDGTTAIYVVPINQAVGELYMPYYGIKTGEENAESNSAVMSILASSVAYGCMFKFPVGNFYFSEPIDVHDRHISILGTTDTNHKNDVKLGVTFLHFTDLTEGETAINVAQCTISDFVICGTEEQYSMEFNRDNAFTDVSTVVKETAGVKAYGIKANGGMLIRNVGFENFYYGCWCENSNMFISNVTFHDCHYGLSIGTDIKVNTISGAEVMVLLQLRGSLSSAIGVRGDSVGQHLAEITGGGNHTLVDLDADFCMDAIVSIDGDINDLSIMGVHGRSGVRHFFTTGDTEITANDITADTVGEYGVITVKDGSSLKGAYIVTNQSKSSDNNPFDGTIGYEVPFVLMSAGTGTRVNGVQIVSTSYGDNELTEEWAKKRIACLSSLANACDVKVQTSKGSVIYTKDGGAITVIDDATDIFNRMDKSSFAKDAEIVKTVNGLYPDVDGNVEIVETEPEVVDYTLDELKSQGDIYKKYVLPDGYIYAYRKKFVAGGTTPNFTNQLPIALDPLDPTEVLNGVGYKENVLYENNIDGQTIDETASTETNSGFSTGLIALPAPKDGEDVVIRVNSMGYHTSSGVKFCRVLRDDYYAYSISKDNIIDITNGGGNYTSTGEYGNGILSDVEIHLNAETCDWLYDESKPFIYAWFWILNTTPPEDVIITVNEEITYTITEDRYVWEWVNTGEQYYKVDYLAMIKALEDRIEKLEGNT